MRHALSVAVGSSVLAASITLTGCAQESPPPRPAAAPPRVYVANESSNSVTVIDAVSHLGVRHIDMPTSPLRVWTAINAAAGSQA